MKSKLNQPTQKYSNIYELISQVYKSSIDAIS